MSKIEVALLVGDESKRWLIDLKHELDRFEALQKKSNLRVEAVVDDESDKKFDAATLDDGEDQKPPKKKSKPVDDDDDDTPPPIAAKKKKVTIEMVNDACKARSSGGRRAEVLKLLKKNFQVESLTDLDESDYAKCLEVMSEED